MTSQGESLKVQYYDDRNLNARIALHARFSTNPGSWQRWVFDHIVERLPDRARLLELGCGPAPLWTANRDRIPSGWQITLTDFSAGMVDTARKNLSDVDHVFTFLVANAQTLALEEDTFDAVVANHMLYHVPDRRRAFEEVTRVLSQNGGESGWFFASTVGKRHMGDMWDLVSAYVPDVHERTHRVSRGFTLENGAEQLSPFFRDIVRDDYPDDLKVTEVEPVIAYLRSSTTLMNCDLDEDMIADLRKTIAREIKTKGAFHIHKASGLFVARTS